MPTTPSSKPEDTTALAKPLFAALDPKIGGKKNAILKENLGTLGVQFKDLTTVKVPSGGGAFFELPGLKGVESVATLEGILLAFHDTRAYFKETFTGEGTAPTCSSKDGIKGVGHPGGICATCPMNEFGTGTNDKGEPSDGKACAEGRLFFMLREQDCLPIVIKLPVMSIRPSRDYMVGTLVANDLSFRKVITSIGLESDKNKENKKYSKATFKCVRKLTEEEITLTETRVQDIKALLAEVPTDHTTTKE